MRKTTNKVAEKPGADPTLPNVKLILGGKEYALCFDFNAIVQAERATGINLLKSIWSEVNAENLRGMLWASLLRENPKLTIEEVGTWITMKNVLGIHTAISEAWIGSVKQDEEAPSQGEDKARV